MPRIRNIKGALIFTVLFFIVFGIGVFMTNLTFTMMFLIIFCIGIFVIYTSINRYKMLQKMKNTPTSRIRSAAVGLVELFGKVRCKEEIVSPITKINAYFGR